MQFVYAMCHTKLNQAKETSMFRIISSLLGETPNDWSQLLLLIIDASFLYLII